MFRRTAMLPSRPPTLTITLIPTTRLISGPLPKELAALGREVLQLSARKQRDSLAAHRHSANDLSLVLAVTGVEIAPSDLVYCAPHGWRARRSGQLGREDAMPHEQRFERTWFLADLTLLDAFVRPRQLRPICDSSIKALILDRILPDPAPVVSAHLDVLKRIRVLKKSDLGHAVWEDPNVVWVCAGTQFGLVIYQSPFRQALRKGQLVGVAGMSPLSESYGGLFLYEWGENQLRAPLRKFYGGVETILRPEDI